VLTLVSHAEYASRALITLEKDGTEQTDGPTDGRAPDRYIAFTARHGQQNNNYE